MPYKTWGDIFYTMPEFKKLSEITDDFNDDINSNHPARSDDESFSDFIDSGSDALIENHPGLVSDDLI